MTAFGAADIADAATEESCGSGLIVRPDAFILSNNQVVDGADKSGMLLDAKARLSFRLLQCTQRIRFFP